ICCIVRRPFIRQSIRLAAGETRKNRPDWWSCSTYQAWPRCSWRWICACGRSRGRIAATRYQFSARADWLMTAPCSRQPIPARDAHPMDQRAEPDPDQLPRTSIDLADAVHAGSQARGNLGEDAVDGEVVAPLARGRDRRDTLDLEG